MSRTTSAESGLVAVRLALGLFFVFESSDKWPWVTHPEQLTAILMRWAAAGSPLSKWYIQTICLPRVSLFAPAVFFGEALLGLALIFGIWTRATALILFFLVLNIHFAHNTLLQYAFLSKGDGLPVLGGLLALLIGSGKGLRKRK